MAGFIGVHLVGAALAAGAAVAPVTVPAEQQQAAFPLIELRQYTLRPGRRDALIDLFEREFLESQDAVGMKVIGQYRDLDNADRFVWIRGFHDMESRAAGLNAFYFGPVWRTHREAANATIIDNDNVLLLRAPGPGAAFQAQPPRPPAGGAPRVGGILVATLYHLRGEPEEAARFFAAEVAPRLRGAGIPVLAYFVPETAPNNFPRLPVRENERVLVWFSHFDSPAEHRRRAAALVASARWAEIASRLGAMLARPPEVLRLAPGARSELR